MRSLLFLSSVVCLPIFLSSHAAAGQVTDVIVGRGAQVIIEPSALDGVVSAIPGPAAGAADQLSSLTPVIGLEPDQLDFSRCLGPGDCEERTFDIFNATNDPTSALVITVIQVTGLGFTLVDGPSTPVTIPGDGTRVTCTVRFCATAGLPTPAVITVFAAAASNSPEHVNLNADSNQLPLCDAGGLYTQTLGFPVTFDGRGSDDPDPDGRITSFHWDFGDGATATGVAPDHVYGAAGSYTVVLTVIDDCGAAQSCSTSALIVEAPVCDAGGPYAGFTEQPIQFDGSASFDPDGVIVAYEWTFGDGERAEGPIPIHTYTLPGIYTTVLRVVDNQAAVSACSTEVTVDFNAAPICDAGGPYSVSVGVPVQMDGTGSSDPDGEISSYSWQFGDGSSGTGPTPVHSYAEPGRYTVSLHLTDDRGSHSSCTTAATTYGMLPPICDAGGPYSGPPGEPVSFDGTGSSDPDGEIVSYLWHFGDGSSGTGPTPSHTYTSIGNYVVSLYLTNDLGECCSCTATATIMAYLTVTAPNGGEEFAPGETTPLTWTTRGTGVPFVDLQLSTNGGATFQDIALGEANDGSFDWLVVNTPTNQALIQLLDSNGSAQPDVSDGMFTIGGVQLVRPNGGEVFLIGALEPIIWEHFGQRTENVRLELSTDGGASFTDIAVSTENDGSLEWHVPNRSTEAGLVRISDVLNPAAGDISNAYFTIVRSGAALPVCDVAGPYSGILGEPVFFDGSGSYDPDGTIASYAWDFGDGSSGTGPTPTHTYDAGTFTVSLTVTDDDARVSTCSTTATIGGGGGGQGQGGGGGWPVNLPPDVSQAVASQPRLWPPDGNLAPVTVHGVIDPDGDPVTIQIVGVTQDEPLEGPGYGNRCPDASFLGPHAALRRERGGSGDGRVYEITFTATDGHGGGQTGTVSVCVPRDQSPNSSCADTGQLFDSSGQCAVSKGFSPSPALALSAAVTADVVLLDYELPEAADVELRIFSVMGRQLVVLENSRRTPGSHQVRWDTRRVASGVYYLRLQAGTQSITKPLLIIR